MFSTRSGTPSLRYAYPSQLPRLSSRMTSCLSRFSVCKRAQSPTAVQDASFAPFVPRQLQPAFPYFLHNLTASAANARGFLQTPLSKIRGNADTVSSSTSLAANFRSTLTVLRQLESGRRILFGQATKSPMRSDHMLYQ